LLPWSTDFIEFVQCASFTGEDVVSRFGPGEGLWLRVVLGQVVVDGDLQFVDAGVTAPADALGRDFGKEAFDQVEPGRAGRREVQLEARVLRQPGLDLGRLVGGVVVEHEMHVARLEDSAVDAAQKAQELPGPVARQAFADDHARLHIECCEQRGRAVALVIVGHRLRPTFLEGKPWLGPVKCLNLRLFVNAKHDRSLWRIKVKSDDIGDFLLEHRVVRHLEPARQVPDPQLSQYQRVYPLYLRATSRIVGRPFMRSPGFIATSHICC
jgi:hypothetical protein